MNGLNAVKFRGQSARQVLAQNAVNDFLEDARILIDASRVAHESYVTWHRIARFFLVLAILSLAIPMIKVGWVIALPCAAMGCLLMHLAITRAHKYLHFCAALKAEAHDKQVGAGNMQAWLDDLISKN